MGKLGSCSEAAICYWIQSHCNNSEELLKMAEMSEVDSNVKSKCLDLCQALVDKGTPFTFSLTIGSNFTLSLDTRGKEERSAIWTRKKPSPSTLRRNARRKEQFLQRKAETTEAPSSISSTPSPSASPLPSTGATYKVLGTSTRVVEKVEGSKGKSRSRAVVLDLPSPIPQVDGEGKKGKKKDPLSYVPPWRRRGEEREEDRRPWYEKIDEHFDQIEAEKAKKSQS